MNNLYITKIKLLAITLFFFAFIVTCTESNGQNDDYTSIFNGQDLSGWMIPEGDGGHWQVIDGVIDYDAMSEAEGDKNLWTEDDYGDFVLRIDWRLKDTPFTNPNVPIIRPDGSHQLNANGEAIRMSVPDADSGIYLRGMSKAQVNIWSWPIGSGEVYGYRMDSNMPPEVVAGVTPSTFADNHIGEWNTFEITMIGDRLTVVLNEQTIIEDVQLPDVDDRGPIALQHHGNKVDGEWASSPSLVQFRNIYIKEI
ncbi:3-keto-disaccharide hydrolase [Rhodohalobacter sp. 8-1]|uniref:3-keto-disaccharide hydrolase n=1 Tax=Rhodohalobacter sp. 8-1 TaxID=3131972 RepID=UPI0030ED4E26